MVIIKTNEPIISKSPSSIIKFWRENPVIAANHLLRRDGEPLTLAPIQEVILTEWFNSQFSLLTASRGSGKALVNGTKVLTERSWVPIEDLSEGDKVITPTGHSSSVVGVYPQGYVKTYTIRLEDRTTCRCCQDHLWKATFNFKDEATTVVTSAWSIKQFFDENRNLLDFNITIPKYIAEDQNIELSIDSIESGLEQECTCIRIEDPQGLFIIDDYIITHNTFMAAVFSALQCILYPGTRIGIFAPAFRQSKLIFKEFTMLHAESPLLQQSILKDPTQGNDQCICTFKSPGMGRRSSELLALPVGVDGGKIRGARLKYAILDEIPHIPESIFRASIHPMMSTSANPMQKVKEIQKLKEKFDKDYQDYIPASSNGYIGITSGYYQFNYWWSEMLNFWDRIQAGDHKYNLRFVPYTELPEGFFDMSVVEDARANSPSHMFLTEWMAKWISDSDGAFSMSLLEEARDHKVIPKTHRDPDKDKGKEYLIAVDVARERDSTSAVVVELGYPCCVVHISELEEKPFPEQAKHIFDLIERFNPIRIEMDPFGGGTALRDYLADPESVGVASSRKIIEHHEPSSKTGKRILYMRPATAEFNEDANNNTKTLLEQRAIKLPAATHPIEIIKKVSSGKGSTILKEVDLVQELINQVASVTVTLTSRGRLHYDLPKASSNTLNVKKKDLYTAFILACNAIYEVHWKPQEEEKPLVQTGVIKETYIDYNSRLTSEAKSATINPRRIVGTTAGNVNSTSSKVIPSGGVIISKNGRRK